MNRETPLILPLVLTIALVAANGQTFPTKRSQNAKPKRNVRLESARGNESRFNSAVNKQAVPIADKEDSKQKETGGKRLGF